MASRSASLAKLRDSWRASVYVSGLTAARDAGELRRQALVVHVSVDRGRGGLQPTGRQVVPVPWGAVFWLLVLSRPELPKLPRSAAEAEVIRGENLEILPDSEFLPSGVEKNGPSGTAR